MPQRLAMASTITNAPVNPSESAMRFEVDLARPPRWGWGWIGWSDLHGLFSFGNPNYARADELLRQGLAITEVRDRREIEDRLSDLREERNRKERSRRTHGIESRSDGASALGLARPPQAEGDKRAKIGRNDPCPCGSGRKYEMCCGR